MISELKVAIGFERWCAPLLDPDTLIAHTGIGDTDHLAEMPRMQLNDATLAGINNGVTLTAGRERVGVLSIATGGDLARSQRWRESLERFGTGDELRMVAADECGFWGRFDLWRDQDDRPFSADDAQLLRDTSTVLGRALRRSTMSVARQTPAIPLPTGVLVIEGDLQTYRATPTLGAWFRLLNPAGVPYADGIPSLVWTAVGRLVAADQGENPDQPARVRMRVADGSWAAVEAAWLGKPGGAIAVSIHAASVEEVLDLLCRAYRLSARERELVTLVVQGLDTDAIADHLAISRYTVQDHLKSIFRKVGANSRLELLAGLLAQVT